MAKLNITFNGVTYSIDESVLADASAKFQTALVELSKPAYSEGLVYAENTRNDQVIGYDAISTGTCTDINLIIPSEYEGLPVLSVGVGEGFVTDPLYSTLESVVIPNSVTHIGTDSFCGCKNLKSVVLGDGVESIYMNAFSYCVSLPSIEIPSSVTTIDYTAFENCTSLTSIVFKGTVEQWNAITKNDGWNNGVPATYVQCSDGQVALN
jgi:hypothetical protein